MHKLTPEQQAIVGSRAPLLSINAFAGTGKTSTLRAYAQARPDERILYLAFNRSVAEEARTKMPANVTVKTSHALAWAQIARSWPKTKIAAKLTAWTLSQSGAHPFLRSNPERAQLVLQIISQFCQSSSLRLDRFIAGIDPAWIESFGVKKADAAAAATAVWARMSKPSDDLPATHDTYYKLWQLSEPSLNYDCIMLDEAQDTNPALFDVFMRQKQATRVLVGDRHQNIYSFRGAMNAMESIDGPHEMLSLTHSFRFGQPIADVANDILHEFKHESLRLTGAAGGPCSADDARLPVTEHKTAMLMRTNAGLFDAAAALCDKGAQIGLLGRFEDYAFDDILDTHRLSVRKTKDIKSAYIRSFGSYAKMAEYADAAQDQEISVRMKVVEKYGDEIPRLYRLIQERNISDADLTLTTAHKSKGQEWSQVILGQDFPDMVSQAGMPLSRRRLGSRAGGQEPLDPGEVNLWYVAVTRAQRHLLVGPQIKRLREAVAHSA